MYKEIVIIFTIIVLIVGLDILTNNYTTKSVAIMSEELNVLRKAILEERKEDSQNQMSHIKEIWQQKKEVLAYYLEHDELEKVETQLIGLAANINMGEQKESIVQLDTAIFILEHIEKKEKFDISSIF